MTFYTIEEVNQHNKSEDCWVISNSKVYNVTNFINKHPGGKFAILSKAGTDVTKHFQYHSEDAKKYGKKYEMGKIKSINKCSIN